MGTKATSRTGRGTVVSFPDSVIFIFLIHNFKEAVWETKLLGKPNNLSNLFS